MTFNFLRFSRVAIASFAVFAFSGVANARFYMGGAFQVGTVFGPKSSPVDTKLVEFESVFRSSVLFGPNGRIGLETTSPFYFAFELEAGAVGVANGGGGINLDIINAGVSVKMGHNNQFSTKFYAILSSDYSFFFSSGGKTGYVYLGGGLGFKQKIFKHLDLFVETKASLPVGAVHDGNVSAFSTHDSTSLVRLMTNVGLDIVF